MSLLEKLADELGVKVGESWEAEGVHEYPKTYVIRDNTLKTLVHYEEEGIGHCGEWIEASMADYVALIKGELKPVWRPKYHEAYYTISFFEENSVELLEWGDRVWERGLLERGLVFKTEEEAIAVAKKMLKSLEED